MHTHIHRGGSRIFERGGGSRLGLQAKKVGPDGGPILGPMLKSLHRGTKGGRTPWGPPLDPLLHYIIYIGYIYFHDANTIFYDLLCPYNFFLKIILFSYPNQTTDTTILIV